MNDRDNQKQDPATPEQLRAALSRLNTCRFIVPPELDAAILRTAREHLAGERTADAARTSAACPLPNIQHSTPNSQHLLKPRGGHWMFDVGCSALDVSHSRFREKAGLRGWFGAFRAGLQEAFAVRRWAVWGGVAVTMIAVGALVWLGGDPRLAARPEDLNGDGVVDMLDAFALARELQHAPASHPQPDLNGDGVVDERDVQALAGRAVRLDQGGRS